MNCSAFGIVSLENDEGIGEGNSSELSNFDAIVKIKK
jgi:hypothetical protein